MAGTSPVRANCIMSSSGAGGGAAAPAAFAAPSFCMLPISMLLSSLGSAADALDDGWMGAEAAEELPGRAVLAMCDRQAHRCRQCQGSRETGRVKDTAFVGGWLLQCHARDEGRRVEPFYIQAGKQKKNASSRLLGEIVEREDWQNNFVGGAPARRFDDVHSEAELGVDFPDGA